MATLPLRSIKGYRLRLTRLDACGVPLDEPDSCRTVVTDGFISVTVAGQVREGRTYESVDIWGNLCVNDKEPGRLMRASVSVSLCDVNPDVLGVMLAGDPVLHAGEAIGMTFSPEQRWPSFALEVWTKSMAGCDQWGYFVAPFCRSAILRDSLTIDNGVLTASVEADVLAASSDWGVTPYALNPFMEPFPAGDLFGLVVSTVTPPALTDLGLCVDRLLTGGELWIDAHLSATV